MDEIVRRRIVARKLCEWLPGGLSRRGEWAVLARGKPPGYKHTQLAQIPRSHYSSKVMQDILEEIMLKKIRREPPGPRRDFLVRDYELWLANGRPTGVAQGPFGRAPPKSIEPIRTWQKGKPIHDDFYDLGYEEREKATRKLLKIQ